MQGMFLAGFLVRNVPFFRDRILMDKMFLFKVGAEIAIDSGEIPHLVLWGLICGTCCHAMAPCKILSMASV